MSTARTNNATALDHAGRLRTRERIAALGQGLLAASPTERDRLAMMLIELAGAHTPIHSQSPAYAPHEQASGPIELLARIPVKWRSRHAQEALDALARGWGNLSEPMRRLAAGLGRDRWLRAAAQLANDPETGARLTAASIAHDTADPGLGKVVATLLSDEQQSVRKAADAAMLRMTMQLLEHLPDELLGEHLAAIANRPAAALPAEDGVLDLERCILLGAVADAAWSFSSHRCRSPLLCLLLLVDRAGATPMERRIAGRMKRLLSERNHPSHAPLRTVLKRTPCPILRERALRWLVIGPIANAALDRLGAADSLLEHERLLCRSALIVRPARAAQLASIKRTRGPEGISASSILPPVGVWDTLSEPARVGLLRLSALLPLDDTHRRATQEPALADPSSIVRLTGASLCSNLELSDYLYDPQPSVARHAALRWSSVGHPAPRQGGAAWSHRSRSAAQCLRSPNPWVRRIALEESRRISTVDPASPASRVQARRMLAADPAGFVRLVRQRFSVPQGRMDALMLVRMLRLESRFELDLIAMVQSGDLDARVRATAVMALGRVDSSSAKYVLRESLTDADTRVRANAVESVDAPGEQILELKSDEHHRVRANAIRRLVCAGDAPMTRRAGEALLAMLGDDRDEHRLAGAWAAQRALTGARRDGMGANWKALIDRVETLGAVDTDARIRGRAAACVHRIGQELRLTRQRADQSLIDEIRSDGQ